MPAQIPDSQPESEQPFSEPLMDSEIPLASLLPGLLEEYNGVCKELTRHNKEGTALKDKKQEFLTMMHNLMKKHNCQSINVKDISSDTDYTMEQTVSERKNSITEALVTRIVVEELGATKGKEIMSKIAGARTITTTDTLSIRKCGKRKEM